MPFIGGGGGGGPPSLFGKGGGGGGGPKSPPGGGGGGGPGASDGGASVATSEIYNYINVLGEDSAGAATAPPFLSLSFSSFKALSCSRSSLT